MAGHALLTVAVSWHVLKADERMRMRAREELIARRRESLGALQRTRAATPAPGSEA